MLQISIWLWFTVIFANFAEAMAEGRGKAQADTLRKMRTKSSARKLNKDGVGESTVTAETLRKGDLFVCEANDLIPADGEIIEGAASVNESAITGESAPVIREAGGDRSAVTGGTTVLSDRIVVRVTANPGESFMDRMIGLIEGAKRQKTPNEIALSILLSALTIIFMVVCITLKPFARYSGPEVDAAVTVTVLVSLLVCLIPTTIGGLLSAIGIAGIDRMVQHNVLAMSGKAVEAAGDVDVLLLDKTGTITLGNRQATEFYPAPGRDRAGIGRCRPAFEHGRRNARRPQHRGARQGEVRHPAPRTARAAARGVRRLHRANANERRERERRANPQRRRRLGPSIRRRDVP